MQGDGVFGEVGVEVVQPTRAAGLGSVAAVPFLHGSQRRAMHGACGGVFIGVQTGDAVSIGPALRQGVAGTVALDQPAVPVRNVPLAHGIGDGEAPVPERAVFVERFDHDNAGLLAPGATCVRVHVRQQGRGRALPGGDHVRVRPDAFPSHLGTRLGEGFPIGHAGVGGPGARVHEVEVDVDAAFEAGGGDAVEAFHADGVEFDGAGWRGVGLLPQIAQPDPRDVVVVEAHQVVAAGGKGVGDGVNLLRFVGEGSRIRQRGSPEARRSAVRELHSSIGTCLHPAMFACRGIQQPAAGVAD